MSVLSKEELMRLAAKTAAVSMADGRGGPFGAVVAKDGAIIATGANRVVRDKDPTAHAEVCAVREACRKLDTHILKGCEIYATCEPCPMCLSAIFWARLDRIFFASTREEAADIGFDDARLYTEVSAPLSARQIPTFKLESDDCAALFEAWRNLQNKVPY